MKSKIIILLCLIFLQSCAHMEKKSKACDFKNYKSKNISIKEDHTKD